MRNSCKKWILLLALLLAVTVGGGAMATSLSDLTLSQYQSLLSTQVTEAAPTVEMTVYSVAGAAPSNAESAVAAVGSEVVYQIAVNSGSGSLGSIENAVLTCELPAFESAAISTDGSVWTAATVADGCVTISSGLTMAADTSETWYVKGTVAGNAGTHTGKVTLTIGENTSTDSADIVISYLRIAKSVINADGSATGRSAIAFSFEVWIDGDQNEYTYQVNGGETQTLKLNEETKKGIVYLRADESLVFLDLPAGTPFTVQEIDIPAGYAQTGLSVNGVEATALMTAASEDENTAATYDVMIINSPQTGSLTITNKVVGRDAPKDGEFKFMVQLHTGKADWYGDSYFEPVDEENIVYAKVSITGNGSVTFSGISAGTTFTVTPVENDQYTPSTSTDDSPIYSGTIIYDQTVTAGFTHTYNYGSMTIRVKDALDDHNSLFNVTGTADTATADIDLTVAINGNQSVTLTELPVGTYTVREASGWTWRYSGDQVKANVSVAADGDIPVAEFTFNTPSTQWLDDYGYAELDN